MTIGAAAAGQAEAEKFITFVLSAAGQKVMQTGDPTAGLRRSGVQ